MGMHNNKLQMVQMNFVSIFFRSSSVIFVPGMIKKRLQLEKEEKNNFLEYFLNAFRYPTLQLIK